jgi:hypothetical protein
MTWLGKSVLAWRAFSRGLAWVAHQRGEARLPAHLVTGIEGEDAAFFYLRRKGLYCGGAALVGGQCAR